MLKVIGYCGLNCSKCYIQTGNLGKAVENLWFEIEQANLNKYWEEIPILGDYSSFEKTLHGLTKLQCSEFCRSDGGNPECAIRICCREKNFEGCWSCSKFENCDKLMEDFLKLIQKINEIGLDNFIAMDN